MLDLNLLPNWYVEKHGLAKTAEVAGKTTSLFAMLQKRNKVPLDAVSRLLAFDPAPLHAVRPLYPPQEEGTRLVILVPLSGPPAPKMMNSVIQLFDRQKMAYRCEGFNNLSVVRNMLAAIALRGPWEWFWWNDADNVNPCGNAPWFKRAVGVPDMPDTFAGLNSITRALSHKKTIVSVCYVDRKRGQIAQFEGGSTPEWRAEVKRGPRDKVVVRPWSGMGGCLTHRSVFEAIIKTQGDEIKMSDAPGSMGQCFDYQWDFFGPSSREIPGDDLSFMARAKKAGHDCYVDLALMSGHGPDRCYTYADITL